MVTDEQFQEQLRKCVKGLRGMGYTFEEIPDHLLRADVPRMEPWQVYAYANPGKSVTQLAAWRRKHHPASLDNGKSALSCRPGDEYHVRRQQDSLEADRRSRRSQGA